MRRNSFHWVPWWYLAIALGFLLLAVNRAIVGEKPWLIGVRAVIAIGFAVLAALEFRTKR
jgi:uncharacterized membrane protein YgaE (UPF0421/DUF939 family)